MKKFFSINNSTDIPEIVISGYIGSGEEADYKSLKEAVDALKAQGATSCIVKVNSGGGDMVEGFAIYDHMRLSGIRFIGEVVGLAASMASVIICACAEVRMYPNARIMVHKPNYGTWGDSQMLRNAADLCDSLEKQAIAAYMAKTKQTEETVKTWLVNGIDKWFSPSEALAVNLADSIIQISNVETVTPLNILPSMKVKEVVELFDNSLNQNSNNMKLNPATYKKLSLPENSTDVEVEAKILAISDENETLKQEAAAFKETRAKELVENAIASKKIKEEVKEVYMSFAKKDYDSTKKALDAIEVSATTSVINMINTSNLGAAATDRSGWVMNDWRKKDPKGLAAMKKDNPEAYKELLKTLP